MKHFLNLVFFHKNEYSARYLRKTVFWVFKPPLKKESSGWILWDFSMFFQTLFYTTFSNQTFARTICTFLFEISLISPGYLGLFPVSNDEKRPQRPQFCITECDNQGCTGDIKAPFEQWLRNYLPAVGNSIKKMCCTL